MPSFPDLSLVIHPVRVPFMTLWGDCGYQIKTTSLTRFIHQRESSKAEEERRESRAGRKITVYDLLAKFELEPPQDFAPAARLFDIFKSQFIDKSVSDGLIDLDNLAVSRRNSCLYRSAGTQNPYLQLSGKRCPRLQMQSHLPSAGLQHRVGFPQELPLLRL